jgi:hypothetical protein
MQNERIDKFWQRYLAMLPAASPTRNEQYVAEGWGDSPRMADAHWRYYSRTLPGNGREPAVYAAGIRAVSCIS